MTHHYDDGLDGKVSRLEIDERPVGASIDFYASQNADDDLVCSLRVPRERTVNFTDHYCDNDAVRSLVLRELEAGRTIRLYDDSSGSTNDDWVEINVKADIDVLTLVTLEDSFENPLVEVIYHRDNGLDGKVSRFEISD